MLTTQQRTSVIILQAILQQFGPHPRLNHQQLRQFPVESRIRAQKRSTLVERVDLHDLGTKTPKGNWVEKEEKGDIKAEKTGGVHVLPRGIFERFAEQVFQDVLVEPSQHFQLFGGPHAVGLTPLTLRFYLLQCMLKLKT